MFKVQFWIFLIFISIGNHSCLFASDRSVEFMENKENIASDNFNADQWDEHYRQTLKKIKEEATLFDHMDSVNSQPLNLETFCKEHNIPIQNCHFPEGTYEIPSKNESVFTKMYGDITCKCGPDIQRGYLTDQGWKIHVSAQPHSATRILKAVLPILKESMQNHHIEFKVVKSIPYLRRLNYLSPYIKGDETQPGKFITIYTKSAYVAEFLIDKLDKKLIQEGLKPNDFMPIKGDAAVGSSGGLYIRYGSYTGNYLVQIKPDGTILSEENVLDDRTVPWPDFMNTAAEWRNEPNPLGNVIMRWKPPLEEDVPEITWQSRPTTHWKQYLYLKKRPGLRDIQEHLPGQ